MRESRDAQEDMDCRISLRPLGHLNHIHPITFTMTVLTMTKPSAAKLPPPFDATHHKSLEQMLCSVSLILISWI